MFEDIDIVLASNPGRFCKTNSPLAPKVAKTLVELDAAFTRFVNSETELT